MNNPAPMNWRPTMKCSAFAFLAMIVCLCPQRLLAEKYSISGCVTNAAGGPARQETVLAWNVGTDLNDVHNGKAKTDKSNGCYEIQHLPSGTYLVSLKDERFAFPRNGAPQAEVHISASNVGGVNLRTDVPDPALLRAGVMKALKSARYGYSSEKNTSVPMNSYLGDFGTGVPAKILSGFEKCAIHYLNPVEGATATELCELAYLKKEDESIALFEKVAQSVRSAIGEGQGFRYDELKGGEGGCVDCIRQTEWVSLLNGAVSLRLLSSHGRFSIQTYSVQLWLIYSQRIAAQNCDWIGKGVLTQIDPKVFQSEIARVTTEVNDINRKVLHADARNLLRLLAVGGTLETRPTPVAATEFPAIDVAANCGLNPKSVALATAAAIRAPQRAAAQGATTETAATIPDGLPVRLSLAESLSSATSKVGDPIHFKVAEDIKVGRLVVISNGSQAIGHILKNEHRGRLGHGGKLEFKLDYIAADNNSQVKVRADSSREGKGKTGKLLTFSLVASPLILLKHGNDATVPEGTPVIAYVDGAQNVVVSASALPGGGQSQVVDVTSPTSTSGAPQGANSISYPEPGDNTPSLVSVKSDPSGADITLDSQFVGNTPSTIKVPRGLHTVVLSKNGFKTWQRTLSVSSGGSITLDATLEKAQ